ncbi:MAG: hypothetical protein U5L45_19530 [Saprospiraceae bacterium]|nr:hypothetical protein [Saprospiraceae bacterium]
MKKSLLITLFIVGTYTLSHAQFTICEKCGETKEGNKIIIEGKGKGSWIVKYNLLGHTTTFLSNSGGKITLKNDGTKTEKDGFTTRRTSSEDGQWDAEVVYQGHDFVKAILVKK